MSASKKRRANETYEEDIRDASTSPRLWKRASRTGSPNMKGARPSLFESNKLSLWQQHVEHLNEDTKRKVLDCSNSVDTFFTVCKHLRVQKDIDDLYHRTPGEVVAMGNDDCLQLGVSPQIINEDEEKPTEYKPTLARHMPSNVIQVAAGGLHSAALTNDGKVYTWGCNDDYALGREVTDENLHLAMQMPQTSFLPEDQGEIVAIDAGDSHTLFLSLNGNVYQTGMYKDMDSGKFRDLPPGETNPKGINKVPVKVDMPQKVRAIAAGFSWNAAILADNSIVTWGKLIEFWSAAMLLKHFELTQRFCLRSKEWAIMDSWLAHRTWALRSQRDLMARTPMSLERGGLEQKSKLKKRTKKRAKLKNSLSSNTSAA